MSPYFPNACPGGAVKRRQNGGKPIQSRAVPKCYFHLLDALFAPLSAKFSGTVARYEMNAMSHRIRRLCTGSPEVVLVIPGTPKNTLGNNGLRSKV
jgi:hypothetical protein